MKRIFIAINLPKEIKEKLRNLEAEIQNSFPMEVGNRVAKWVREDNLHITLSFIGEVKDGVLPRVCETIERAAKDQEAFDIILEKTCYGAVNRGVPRLIWVETKENSKLKALAVKLKKELKEQGILRQPDSRPFSGHITLARVRAWVWQKIEPEERPDIEKEIKLIFKTKSIDIMESQLKRSGPEYNVLSKIKLS